LLVRSWVDMPPVPLRYLRHSASTSPTAGSVASARPNGRLHSEQRLDLDELRARAARVGLALAAVEPVRPGPPARRAVDIVHGGGVGGRAAVARDRPLRHQARDRAVAGGALELQQRVRGRRAERRHPLGGGGLRLAARALHRATLADLNRVSHVT
jgi:hypothetical protein